MYASFTNNSWALPSEQGTVNHVHWQNGKIIIAALCIVVGAHKIGIHTYKNKKPHRHRHCHCNKRHKPVIISTWCIIWTRWCMPSLIKQLMIDLSSNNSDSIVVVRIPIIITVSDHHRYEGQQQWPHPHPLHRHATFSLTTDIVEGLSTHVLRTIINLIKVIVPYYAVLAIVASHHHHDDAREIIIRNTRWCTKKIRRIEEIIVHPHLRQCHLVIDNHCK